MNPTDQPLNTFRTLVGNLPSLEEVRQRFNTEHPESVLDEMTFASRICEKPTAWLESSAIAEFGEPPLLRKLILRELKKRWEEDKNEFFMGEAMERETVELRWGSFGLSGKETMKIYRLAELDTDHIQNILAFCVVEQWYRLVLLRLLRKRWQTEQKTETVLC